jgi:abhydrolase domain-containing protein 6
VLINVLHNRVRRRYQRFGYQSRFLDLERCTLHCYERKGSQPEKTLVLLHGLGTSSSTWVHLLPALDPAWTVLALDLPGFGFSTVRDGESFFRFHELYNAVVTFIGETITTPFVLLGHSLGGWLAAKYAADHGESLRRLILVNNAGILHEGTIDQAYAFDLRSVRDLSRLLNTLWMRYPWYFKPFYPAILHDLRERHVSEFVRSIQPGDFVNEDLKRLMTRVSIVWGTADRLFAMKSVEIMKEAIPRAQIDLMDDCGHVPQLEKPKEFTGIIRNILRGEAS